MIVLVKRCCLSRPLQIFLCFDQPQIPSTVPVELDPKAQPSTASLHAGNGKAGDRFLENAVILTDMLWSTSGQVKVLEAF
jgi:hypothetical protein